MIGDEEDHDTDDEGYESPTPTWATHIESFCLVSHALTEEGGIHLNVQHQPTIRCLPESIHSRPTTDEKSTVSEGF